MVCSTAALLPGSVFGLGTALPDQDAFATARGNAFVATANNPSAVYYNPAGISQLEGMNLSAGAYGIIYGSTFRGDGTRISSQEELGVLPQVFSTMSFPKLHLTFGLGTYSPYGLRYEWPANAPFLGEGETGSIQYIRVNPVFAYKVCSTLSIAAGPTLNYSEADLKEFPTIPTEAGPVSFINHFRGRDVDVGYDIGILWHPLEQHSFGVTYRSATDMNYSGHATVPSPLVNANVSATVNFHFPQTLAFGYSYRPTKYWNIEADGQWTDWTSLRTLGVNPFASQGDSLTLDWKKSWIVDLGVTRYFGNGWRASAGYMYSMNSVPEANFNPLVPDSDRDIFSIGIGKSYKYFSWDAAYQLLWGPSRTITGDSFPPADGKYEFFANALTFNIGLHF